MPVVLSPTFQTYMLQLKWKFCLIFSNVFLKTTEFFRCLDDFYKQCSSWKNHDWPSKLERQLAISVQLKKPLHGG